jgi:hypothetical protein
MGDQIVMQVGVTTMSTGRLPRYLVPGSYVDNSGKWDRRLGARVLVERKIKCWIIDPQMLNTSPGTRYTNCKIKGSFMFSPSFGTKP